MDDIRNGGHWLLSAPACMHAYMHACMHAAGTKSAIPPPLSHPLSPTLFVSLTVLFAPLCPPLLHNQAAAHRDTIYSLGNGKTNYVVFFEKKRNARKIWTGSRYHPFPSSIVFLFFFFSPFFSLLLFSFFISASQPCSLSFLFDRSRFLFFFFPGFFSLPFSSSFPRVPYREKQHVLAIDTGTCRFVCITSLSFSLSLFLLARSSTLARFGDLLSFLFFPSSFLLFSLPLFARIVSSLPCRA